MNAVKRATFRVLVFFTVMTLWDSDIGHPGNHESLSLYSAALLTALVVVP